MPYFNGDQIADTLVSRGWAPQKVEFITDSNYVRKTWMKTRVRDNVKAFFIYYEFTRDSSENYIIYQFTDRPSFLNYKKEIVKMGYKLLTKKARKKLKATDKITLLGKEDLFYSEKTGATTIIEDAFYLGLNAFMIYSFKANSAIAKHLFLRG